MVRYDEDMMMVRLRGMNARSRTAFAAACAERLLPAYRIFAVRKEHGASAVLEEALAMLWKTLSGTALEGIEYAAEAEKCEALVPGEDEEQETAYAQNAVAAVAYALRTFVTGDAQEAIWAARQGYEAADLRVVRQGGLDLNAPGSEDLILSHPIVQAELTRQERDLQELAEASNDDLPRLISELRERAKRESFF